MADHEAFYHNLSGTPSDSDYTRTDIFAQIQQFAVDIDATTTTKR